MKNLPKINSERWLDIADLPQEKWSQITMAGDGDYYASNYGRVKNIAYINVYQNHLGTAVKRTINAAIHPVLRRRDGWAKVAIKDAHYYLHHIIANAFMGYQPKTNLYVYHKDGNRGNNLLENIGMEDINRVKKPLDYCLLIIKEQYESIEGEEWAFYPQYEGRILISNQCRVFRAPDSLLRRGKMFRPAFREGNLCCARVSIDGGLLTLDVRKFVLGCFGKMPDVASEDYDYRPEESELSKYLATYINVGKDEQWRYVVGMQNDYAVSDEGRVVSMRYGSTKRPKELRPWTSRKGYASYVLVDRDGVKHSITLHRIVAMAFIPNPNNKDVIDHIDTNPANNKVKNLRWVTVRENCNNPLTLQHKREASFRQPSLDYRERRRKRIFQYGLNGVLVRTWRCAREVSESMGCNLSTLRSHLSRLHTPLLGYYWSYDSPNERKEKPQEPLLPLLLDT